MTIHWQPWTYYVAMLVLLACVFLVAWWQRRGRR